MVNKYNNSFSNQSKDKLPAKPNVGIKTLHTLLSQVFVIDGETKIEKLLENKSSDLNEDIIITRFTRMQLGDGIEKKEDDFAGEVAAAINKN